MKLLVNGKFSVISNKRLPSDIFDAANNKTRDEIRKTVRLNSVQMALQSILVFFNFAHP